MKNENHEKKNFITNIREMTPFEKAFLGLEIFSYLAAAGALAAMGIGIAVGYDDWLVFGLDTGSFVLNSQILRLGRSTVELNNNTVENIEATSKIMEAKQKIEEDTQKCLKKIL